MLLVPEEDQNRRGVERRTWPGDWKRGTLRFARRFLASTQFPCLIDSTAADPEPAFPLCSSAKTILSPGLCGRREESNPQSWRAAPLAPKTLPWPPSAKHAAVGRELAGNSAGLWRR